MRQYAIRRLLFLPPVLLAVSSLTFFATKLVPGDPALTFLGLSARPEEIEAFHRANGLDKPLLAQYFNWLLGILHGDPGRSLLGGVSIQSELAHRFPVTLSILVCSFTFVMFFGLLFGIIAALFQDTPLDYAVRSFSILGQSVPAFFTLTLLVLIPAILWRYSPPIGWIPIWQDPWRAARQIVPLTMVLAIGGSALLMRLMRASLLEVLRADFVRTARAKGLQARTIMYRHAVRNALIPVLTVAGLILAELLGGSIILENITSLPGLGQYTFNAALNRDYNVIMTMVMYSATVIVLSHLVVDLLYATLDPRIKYR
ncbi:MAG: ABC transporter permease [Dehalococcoidia bacterium]